jgi:hypothetical protein
MRAPSSDYRGDPPTGVYNARAPLAAGEPTAMARIATLHVPDALFVRLVGGITGGDIAPDGRRVM